MAAKALPAWRRNRIWRSYIILIFSLGFILGMVFQSRLISSPFHAMPVNDRDYFPVAYSLISNANRSVYVAVFYAKHYPSYPGSQSNLLLEELARKAREVEVKVYLDDLFNESISGYEFLKERGVDVRYGGRKTVHAKLVIVDGEYVLVGSTNWGYYSLSRNHEANVLVRSPALARAFERYFMGIWEEAGRYGSDIERKR